MCNKCSVAPGSRRCTVYASLPDLCDVSCVSLGLLGNACVGAYFWSRKWVNALFTHFLLQKCTLPSTWNFPFCFVYAPGLFCFNMLWKLCEPVMTLGRPGTYFIWPFFGFIFSRGPSIPSASFSPFVIEFGSCCFHRRLCPLSVPRDFGQGQY